ncbi:serine phosphatase RsbU (regulator of sigma subunit) [Actinomadura pelletieri DSM 43383]|uniref:protein-serine/threonine phosphatase n=1 Tax=Actinomadura pelletieri DSM 43383 TaxID=1120940 RepID=A0A495QJA5_9ACTN|nr:SpoIIE family protein phosphatase [Actinomadura pelletieri]RKS72227.1 serine phosphatase RsbU (regulator of sigma subunit) [Actinomadura pelletieri DSM 43383]
MVIADLLGVARMAAITLDDDGRVVHWDDTATDLFGVGRREAVNRPLGLLLRLPPEVRGVFEPEIFGHVWCGACTVPRVDNGRPVEVAWWVYPIESGAPGDGQGTPGDAQDVRVLALAADLCRLRRDGPRVTIGDQPVEPLDGYTRHASGARLLRVEPVLATPSLQPASAPYAAPYAGPFAARLAELLPGVGAATSEWLASRVLGLGCPAVSLGVTVPLPIVPYTGRATPVPGSAASVPGSAASVPGSAASVPGSATSVPGSATSVPGSATARPQPPHSSRPDATRPPPDPSPCPERGLETMAVREPLTYLGEAGQQIGSSLDHLQTARTLAEVLVPRLADYAAVELLECVATDSAPPAAQIDETTQMRRVAVVHNDEPGRWDDAVPEGEALLLPPGTPFVQAMRTGRPVHIPRVGAKRAAELSALFGDRDLRALFTGRTMLVVPLIARGRVLGTCKLLRKPDRAAFGDLDLAMVDELARRAALCIDNGRLYRREVQVAEELQRSMLPDDPPDVAGARVRYRYRPAEQAVNVGGDWFDAIPLPGCRLGIVVGDVMGHGLTSAAIMGQLRTAVRTLAAEDMRPARLLRQLDGLARRLGEGYLATCLYAVYDPVERRCTLANAGHVPPVLVSALGDSRVLQLPSGVPIGVGGEPFEAMEVEVEDGAQLVLCTDGLLERRDRDIEEGLAELRERLVDATTDLDLTCDSLLDGLAASTPADDIAIVAVGFDGIPKDDVGTWSLAPEPSTVPWVRSQVAGKLAEWNLETLTDTVQLLVSELVTNALVHGAGAIDLRLIKGLSLLCEVYDDGADLPRLRHADATDESGRGLQLVSHLASRWGTHRAERGKVVWFEHDFPPPRPPG